MPCHFNGLDTPRGYYAIRWVIHRLHIWSKLSILFYGSAEDLMRKAFELELNDAVKKGNLDAALKTVEKIFAAQHSFAMRKIYAFDAFIIVIDIFNEYTT